jgi:hypothetical protein
MHKVDLKELVTDYKKQKVISGRKKVKMTMSNGLNVLVISSNQ